MVYFRCRKRRRNWDGSGRDGDPSHTWDEAKKRGMTSACVWRGWNCFTRSYEKSKQWHESCKKVDVSWAVRANRLRLRLLLLTISLEVFFLLLLCYGIRLWSWQTAARQEAIWHEKKGTRDNLQICQLSYYVLLSLNLSLCSWEYHIFSNTSWGSWADLTFENRRMLYLVLKWNLVFGCLILVIPKP